MKPSYGDVTAEYLAVRRQSGAVETHEVVWVTGPDTVSFLDGLISQSLATMRPGQVAPSLLLSPQGKLRAPHWVLMGDEEAGLVTDLGSGGIVIEDLVRFKIRVDVAISATPDPVIDVWGPEAADTVVSLGLGSANGWARHGDRLVATIPFRGGGELPRFVIGGVGIDEVVSAGATRVGSLAATTARIEQGEPLNGVDVDEKTIPEEANLVAGAVDFEKGCYLGQELVARIDSRGHVNRQLRGLELTTNVVPPVGASVAASGKVVGELSSVGESLDLRAPIALALLRREVSVEDAVTISWDGGNAPAVVRSLPML